MSDTPSGGEETQNFERRIVPGAESLIVVQISPNAVCFLSHPALMERRIQLDADDRGYVRFHARAPKHGATLELNIESRGADGQTMRHKVTMRGDHHASSEQTIPAPCGNPLPPLEGDPMALSNAELIARGYPPRPDPSASVEIFARWHRKISRPFIRVTPAQVPHPGVSFSRHPTATEPHIRTNLPVVTFSPTLPLPPPLARAAFNSTSGNWSGALLTQPALQFSGIQADWYVPGVNSGDVLYSAAAEWVGLDNGSTDLYQAGTDSECLFFFGWTITIYWMWAETLPFAPWGLPNFPISPRDDVSVDIFLADQNGQTWFRDGSNGGLTPADNSVWLMIYNHSQGLSFWGFYPTAPEAGGGLSTSGFTGTTAEFIVERPSVNGASVPLANFGVCGMHSCWYSNSLFGNRPFKLGANGSTPFDGNLSYLTMLNGGTGNTLAVPISLPDTTNPGGYEIVWIWTGYN